MFIRHKYPDEMTAANTYDHFRNDPESETDDSSFSEMNLIQPSQPYIVNPIYAVISSKVSKSYPISNASAFIFDRLTGWLTAELLSFTDSAD